MVAGRLYLVGAIDSMPARRRQETGDEERGERTHSSHRSVTLSQSLQSWQETKNVRSPVSSFPVSCVRGEYIFLVRTVTRTKEGSEGRSKELQRGGPWRERARRSRRPSERGDRRGGHGRAETVRPRPCACRTSCRVASVHDTTHLCTAEPSLCKPDAARCPGGRPSAIRSSRTAGLHVCTHLR